LRLQAHHQIQEIAVADKSKIEWTDASWNPIVGCSKVSEGCRNCYAIRSANRMNGNIESYRGLTVIKNGKPEWTGTVRFIEERLTQPLLWKRPRMIFVNSMSDLFHEDVADRLVAETWAIMAMAPQHIFQVLTKRAKRMKSFLEMDGFLDHVQFFLNDYNSPVKIKEIWPLLNVWLGVSVENQQAADERIPLLLQTPASVRWISAEPLLGEIDLESYAPFCFEKIPANERSAIKNIFPGGLPRNSLNDQISPKLNWVVAGGESGPNARPSHPDWFRSLRDQCLEYDIPFFFKQWGEWGTTEQFVAYKNSVLKTVRHDGSTKPLRVLDYDLFPILKKDAMIRVGKKTAGRLLDGIEWNEYPEVEPQACHPEGNL